MTCGICYQALCTVSHAPIERVLTADDLRQPQTPTTGINAIFGKWPGDETDAEIQQALDEIS